jgi:hypothetical protein
VLAKKFFGVYLLHCPRDNRPYTYSVLLLRLQKYYKYLEYTNFSLKNLHKCKKSCNFAAENKKINHYARD